MTWSAFDPRQVPSPLLEGRRILVVQPVFGRKNRGDMDDGAVPGSADLGGRFPIEYDKVGER